MASVFGVKLMEHPAAAGFGVRRQAGPATCFLGYRNRIRACVVSDAAGMAALGAIFRFPEFQTLYAEILNELATEQTPGSAVDPCHWHA